MKTFLRMNHWTTEQAHAVWEFISTMEQLVWEHNEDKILNLIKPELEDPPDFGENPDDDMPF